MKSVSKVTGVNLAIMLIYSLLIRFTSTGSQKGLSILIFSAFVIGIHVIALLIAGAVFYASKESERGKVFMLSAGLVLLIGFSSCWANASI